MTKSPRLWGYVAEYSNPAEIYHACEEIRDAGYTKWDACTPFCVHGLDKAMGLKPSKLPWFVLGGGLTGGTTAMLFMLWTSVIDYPLNIGGKPLASVPAFIPITFELTVLFSAFSAFFGLWFLCGLPRLHYPPFAKKVFAGATDDKFLVVIESTDPNFDDEATKSLLEKTGATVVERVDD